MYWSLTSLKRKSPACFEQVIKDGNTPFPEADRAMGADSSRCIHTSVPQKAQAAGEGYSFIDVHHAGQQEEQAIFLFPEAFDKPFVPDAIIGDFGIGLCGGSTVHQAEI